MRWVVILAGGSGTRFWPKSRQALPKQFLPLAGEETLLQQAMARARPLVPPERTLVVSHARYGEAVRRLLPALPLDNLLLEPQARNTAPAIGLAAALLARRDPEAEMAVLPADHHIAPVERFAETMEVAFHAAAREPCLVTLGVVPAGPAVEYGWIEAGEQEGEERGIPWHAVKSFREKPDLETAKKYAAAGGFFWNAGIFCFRASTLLAALETRLPELAAALKRVAEAAGAAAFAARMKELFPKAPAVSMDYGVLEKARNLKVVRADFQWDDLGSWLALARLRPKDGWGNVLAGEILAEDSQGCIVIAEEGHLVAALGARDLVIVHTKDATLVCPKSEASRIREVVERLKGEGKERYL